MGIVRREVLGGTVGLAGLATAVRAMARERLDLGVQLWMVRRSMAADFPGTLARLSRLGIRKVELAGAPDLPAATLRRHFDDAGLACVSGHLPVLQMTDAEVERRLAFAVEVGMADVVAPMAGFAGLLELQVADRLAALMSRRPTEDDWKWNADRLNALGEKARTVGLRLSYHNHNVEFADLGGGRRPMDLLLARVDPAQAHFQLDVGNAVLGGGDPFVLLTRHPGRFRTAHIKDWQAPLEPTTRLASPASAAFGKGLIDWPRWRAASAAAGLMTSFIERENMPADGELGAVEQALDYFGALGLTPRRDPHPDKDQALRAHD